MERKMIPTIEYSNLELMKIAKKHCENIGLFKSWKLMIGETLYGKSQVALEVSIKASKEYLKTACNGNVHDGIIQVYIPLNNKQEK